MRAARGVSARRLSTAPVRQEAPADVAPPFAEAFYRVRTEPGHVQRVALLSPGNKKQQQQLRADVAVASPTYERGSTHVWRVPLESSGRGILPCLVALMTVSVRSERKAVSFRLASRHHSAKGVIRLQGCTGSADSGLGAQHRSGKVETPH